MLFKSNLKWILFLGLLSPTISQAEEWVQIKKDADIHAALAGHTLRYDAHSIQLFKGTGETLYLTERASDGLWEARDGKYCSAWPPSKNWTCYDLSMKDETLRFTRDDGTFSEGKYDNNVSQ